MEIKTKYNIGDNLYFYDKGHEEIKEVTIQTITTKIYVSKEATEAETGIIKKIPRTELEYNGWFTENELFPTKEDVKEYLKHLIDEL